MKHPGREAIGVGPQGQRADVGAEAEAHQRLPCRGEAAGLLEPQTGPSRVGRALEGRRRACGRGPSDRVSAPDRTPSGARPCW